MKICPVCRVALVITHYEGRELLRCPQCHGHLVMNWVLEALKRSEIASNEDLKREAMAESPPARAAALLCPYCARTMKRRAEPLGPYALNTDFCPQCSRVWLDGGELALAQLAYRSGRRRLDREMQARAAALDADPARRAEFERQLAELPEDFPSSESGDDPDLMELIELLGRMPPTLRAVRRIVS